MVKSKKPKPIKVDGLGPKEKQKIRNAVRQIWHRSHARKLCVTRALDAEGFAVCEKCKRRTPKNHIDHKIKVGEVDGGFIERMFVSSKYLQALCKRCHDAKTKLERAANKKIKDFF